jgi:hypothetical protein
MKKASILLALAILLIGGIILTVSSPALAQMTSGSQQGPYTGDNSPWTYYKGDWFKNGVLHYYYGNNRWAPYYSKGPGSVQRPNEWYGEKWQTYNQQHPQNLTNFESQYPYWSSHQVGQKYDEKFYHQHHPEQGGGWQREPVYPSGT